ncbi:nucleotide-binding protein [Clostridium sp. Marseille-P2415]|uniref:nucleotide-binding protein n=1 Tax=Clostridium sp. Marseille-P2415 TaxID=1805471 RepID=UPI0009888CB3|nr:AAA family ATPase [Clostridium sp. Marseille-P2415]
MIAVIVIAINEKGDVVKMATATALSQQLAKRGYRIAFIDFDTMGCLAKQFVWTALYMLCGRFIGI